MFKTFINAILAGIAIGIAGAVNLSVGGGLAGATLFGFGLFIILCFQFKLYTGAIGYLVNQSKASFFPYVVTLITIWLGNFVGTYLVGWLIRQTRLEKIPAAAAALCAVKTGDTLTSIFILSIFCGLLMYIAVESYRQKLPDLFRAMIVFLCVIIFILSGFEHCIANMYYFCAAGAINKTTLLYILVMTAGNSVGGMFLPTMDMIRKE